MSKYNAFQIVKDFEQAVCEYTGARFCVAVNSCTNALFLCLVYAKKVLHRDLAYLQIPSRTYLSVPMQIKHAGYRVRFVDREWTGIYQLWPFEVYDSARRFTSKMYMPGTLMCVSFHWSKILGIQQGGAILHNDPEFDVWARKARFDGRTEGVAPKDDNPILGWHMYLSPEIAAEGLVRLMHLPRHNLDLPNDDYPDLSKLEIFK